MSLKGLADAKTVKHGLQFVLRCDGLSHYLASLALTDQRLAVRQWWFNAHQQYPEKVLVRRPPAWVHFLGN